MNPYNRNSPIFVIGDLSEECQKEIADLRNFLKSKQKVIDETPRCSGEILKKCRVFYGSEEYKKLNFRFMSEGMNWLVGEGETEGAPHIFYACEADFVFLMGHQMNRLSNLKFLIKQFINLAYSPF